MYDCAELVTRPLASLFGLKDPELADLAHFLTHFKP